MIIIYLIIIEYRIIFSISEISWIHNDYFVLLFQWINYLDFMNQFLIFDSISYFSWIKRWFDNQSYNLSQLIIYWYSHSFFISQINFMIFMILSSIYSMWFSIINKDYKFSSLRMNIIIFLYFSILSIILSMSYSFYDHVIIIWNLDLLDMDFIFSTSFYIILSQESRISLEQKSDFNNRNRVSH